MQFRHLVDDQDLNIYYTHRMNQNIYQHMNALPLHRKLCGELLSFFRKQSGITGALISGSGVSGKMDNYSDLDLGFVCESDEVKNKIWNQRYDWNLPAWFHRMDADHVKPFFIIYLFEPHIHVDLVFYTLENLPPQAGGPYAVAWDDNKNLNIWLETANGPYKIDPDWSNVVHEEERFWTWLHYSWGHVARGEYYDVASQFEFLRKIPHSWNARLLGSEGFDSRRLEQKDNEEFINQMKVCFPKPDRLGTKSALMGLVEVHNQQRILVEKLIQPKWKTTQYSRDKITKLLSLL